MGGDTEKRSLLGDGGPSSVENSVDMGDTRPNYNTTDMDDSGLDYDGYPGRYNGFDGNTYPPASKPRNRFEKLSLDRQVSVLEHSVTLTWKDVKVKAPLPDGSLCGCLKRNKQPQQYKHILKGVNGVARAGSFLVIMGASGSGKTTLLNVLTRRNLGALEVEGQILANGVPIGDNINSLSGYIQQDDLFVGSLTVKEHLWFNAVLRMKKDVSNEHRLARIEAVMKEMGLKKCENTVIGIPGMVKGISGGEKKRLAFAAELITRPPIMFCDEPTSGLDSFMAQNVVESLKTLTNRGHTILCTIHQPSSEVFAMFDQILLMAEGRVAFMGPTDELEGFFSDHGYICPTNYNPADFFIMTLAIVPGREKECRENVKAICDSFDETNFARSIKYQTDEQELLGGDKFVIDMEKVGNGDISRHDKEQFRKNFAAHEGYLASWWKQFTMCLWRSSLDARRNKKVLPARILQLTVTGFLVGMLWWQQPLNMAGISNINGAMFTFIIQCSFNTAFCIATSFTREFPIFVKEHCDRQYSTSAYYLGKILIDLPVIAFATTCYMIFTYWMIGLDPLASKFFIALFAVIFLALSSASWGHCASATFPNAQLALTMLPFILGGTMLCSGFLIKENSIPKVFLPLSWISAYKYAYEILIINQWLDNSGFQCEFTDQLQESLLHINSSSSSSSLTTPVPSENGNLCYPDGLAIIRSFQYDPDSIAPCFIIMIVLTLLIQLLGYACFRARTRSK